MNRDPNTDRFDQLRRNAPLLIAALALCGLLIVVWRQGNLFPAKVTMATPEAQATPGITAPVAPISPQAVSPVLATSTPAPGNWTVVPSLFDGKVNALLVEDPDGKRILYAATDGGVFTSQDRGRTWEPANNGLDDRLVRSLVSDPDDPRVLYAGTWNGRVYASSDGGESWVRGNTGLPPQEVMALAVHTYDPRRLYALTASEVFTSADSGQTWHAAAELTGTLQCMAMDAEYPDTLYVGTEQHGIYKTINGGASWFRLPGDLTDVSALVIPPRTVRTLYAISEARIWKTETGGFVWTYADYWREPSVARSIAINPKNPQEVFVGLQDGLHRSEDGRKSWVKSDAGLEGKEIQTLTVDPIEPNIVYACSGNLVFISDDSGRTWEQHGSIPGYRGASILALEPDPKDGDTFYASVAGGGLYSTTDRGEHWEHVGELLPLGQITALAVDPVDTLTVYVGAQEGIVFKSSSGGTTWLSGGLVARAPIQALALDPEQRQHIYVGTGGEGLFVSEDGGAHWSHKDADIGVDVRQIVIDPRGSQTMIYVLTEAGVFTSIDAGSSWEQYLSEAVSIARPQKGTAKLIVVVRPDPRLVVGQGRDQSVIVAQASIAPEARVEALNTGPAFPNAVYAIASRQGVYRSTDLGASWQSLGPGLQLRQLQTIALSADHPDLMLVGTDEGIYRYEP